jgi:hypothetical protein
MRPLANPAARGYVEVSGVQMWTWASMKPPQGLADKGRESNAPEAARNFRRDGWNWLGIMRNGRLETIFLRRPKFAAPLVHADRADLDFVSELIKGGAVLDDGGVVAHVIYEVDPADLAAAEVGIDAIDAAELALEVDHGTIGEEDVAEVDGNGLHVNFLDLVGELQAIDGEVVGGLQVDAVPGGDFEGGVLEEEVFQAGDVEVPAGLHADLHKVAGGTGG